MMIFGTLSLLSLSFFAVYGQELNFQPKFLGQLINKCRAERKEPWSYRGLNGPPFWGLMKDSSCYGMEQSPIAISSTDAIKDNNLAKLDLNGYEQPITQWVIVNNGHTAQVTPSDGVSRTISVNGDEYSLLQFHPHWGDRYDRGSEHTLDGTQYAMEMHFVHMNANGQIAVVGVFFQEQDDNNEDLENLVAGLDKIPYKNDNASIQSNINLNKLVPANPTSFYRYQGSLTTPPCSEGVTWSVVPDPISVGRDQMNKFRQLYSVEEKDANDRCRLVNNFRPLQLLSGRTVYFSQ